MALVVRLHPQLSGLAIKSRPYRYLTARILYTTKGTSFGSAVIGFSCCGVPALIFCLHIYNVFFFFCILQGKANKIKNNIKNTSSFQVESLLTCGDIAKNPVPKVKSVVKFPCVDCKKSVRTNQDAILCGSCTSWFHTKCPWYVQVCVPVLSCTS